MLCVAGCMHVRVHSAQGALSTTDPRSELCWFDCACLADFCADSPASQEWRVLLQLLEQYEETVAGGCLS